MTSFSAVVTTGIYCRPGCAARPHPEHVRPFALAAAAEAAGFRACLRCRPYRSRPARRLEAARSSCAGRCSSSSTARSTRRRGRSSALGSGISPRHLRRLFAEHVGVTPDQLARSQTRPLRPPPARRHRPDRSPTSRSRRASAASASSTAPAASCSEPRRASCGPDAARPTGSSPTVASRCACRSGRRSTGTRCSATSRRRAIGGVEHVAGDTYRRTIVVDGDPGVLELLPGGPDHLLLRAHLPHWEGLIHVVERARRIFDLDADLDDATCAPRRRPRPSEPCCAARPGPARPGNLGSVRDRRARHHRPAGERGRREHGHRPPRAAARHARAGTARRSGSRTPSRHRRRSPTADLAGPRVPHGARRGHPQLRRARSPTTPSASTAASGSTGSSRRSRAVPGLGPWTAHYLALRLGEPDAFPAADLGLRRAAWSAARCSRTAQLARLAQRWSPWRALAAVHLWLSGGSGSVTGQPTTGRPPPAAAGALSSSR